MNAFSAFVSSSTLKRNEMLTVTLV